MSIRYRVAVQGFSAFEKATFESFFRLAARRAWVSRGRVGGDGRLRALARPTAAAIGLCDGQAPISKTRHGRAHAEPATMTHARACGSFIHIGQVALTEKAAEELGAAADA